MRKYIILFYAWLLDQYRKPLMWNNKTIGLLYAPGFNSLRKFNSQVRAYYEFWKAKRRVPAYAGFLKEQNFDEPSFSGFIPNIHEIPETDKESYVKRYSMNERCVNGKIPNTGVIIDESSGSSGTATNWARGTKERGKNAKIIQFCLQKLLGEKPLFVINAFALGPWATGVNITMSCVKFSKLKSLGPDRAKIINTIKHFGKDHHYVIMGYPPFLKQLVDESSIEWEKYQVTFVFGGESMTEGMRDHLNRKGIKKIYSSLGASDLELNLGAENDFTIGLRRLLRDNSDMRSRLLKFPGALPMIFQYHPADFYFESSPNGELIVSVSRSEYIAPKIRYNIHDKGHVVEMKEIFLLLKELNIDASVLGRPMTDLPLLFHYGRADMTVSFFGSNIGPTDLQEVIYSLPQFSDIVNSYCIDTQEDNEGNKKLIVSLELMKDKKNNGIALKDYHTLFFERLQKINQDFREASKMVDLKKQAEIRFYENDSGPFKSNDIRIKLKYINS
jgi:phenylacetate-CoA ligase